MKKDELQKELEMLSIELEKGMQIIEEVQAKSGINVYTSTRKRSVVEVRHIAMWLVSRNTRLKLIDITRIFNMKSHASIKHSIAFVDDMIATNRGFREKYVELLGCS